MVLEFLEKKVASGYFRKPRLALPLFLEMKRTLPPGSFTAMELERALAKLLRNNEKLTCSPIDIQNHYHDSHEIFLAHASDTTPGNYEPDLQY